MEIFYWAGLIFIIVGFVCFSAIAFKRSAWWEPSKGMMQELDSTEKRFIKLGFIALGASFTLFIVGSLV